MMLRPPLHLLPIVRTMVQSRDFIVQNLKNIRTYICADNWVSRRANTRVALSYDTLRKVVTGATTIVVPLVLMLGLSGCNERQQEEFVLEWECDAGDISAFLQKQGLFQYDEAQVYCKNLSVGGKGDWRLPARHELLNFPLQALEMQHEVLPLHSRAMTCWSSTPYHDSRLRYWAVSVSNKQAAPLKKETYNAVICVRGIAR
ncbi:MAG: DUF1566 domain-containing protein [Desulfuromonadaceae bacterium]|nr:DUF1566 domain-containing protein [Desulfuromonadaceae bacterium]